MMNDDIFKQMQEEFDYANITDKTQEQNYRTDYVARSGSFGTKPELNALFPWWITTSIVFVIGLALLRLVVKTSVDN